MNAQNPTSAELSQQDAAIVREVLAGNETAFDQLVLRYHRRLFQIAYGVMNNAEDAEEVVQDSFVKAFRNLGSFRADSSFYTWIQRITLNTARDRYQYLARRGSKTTFSLSAVDDPNSDIREEDIQVPSDAYSPEKLFLTTESMDVIEKAFRQLPPPMREALTLRHMDQLSYEEIADVTGANVGTVKSRLARGRDLLHRILHSIQ